MGATMGADGALYLDSSALVKLVVAEAESDALRFLLRDWPTRVSCALALTEVPRAVRGQGPKAVLRARALPSRTHLLRLDDLLLDAAAALDPQVLRNLDAIHLAAAQSLGETLGAIVTYDQRMAEAAKVLGLAVQAPA